MASIKDVEEFLHEGEAIQFDDGDFFVTNKRLIRLKTQLIGGFFFKDISLNHLSNVQITRDFNEKLIFLGVLVAFLPFVVDFFFKIPVQLLWGIVGVGYLIILFNFTRPEKVVDFIADNNQKISYKYKDLEQTQKLAKMVRKLEK